MPVCLFDVLFVMSIHRVRKQESPLLLLEGLHYVQFLKGVGPLMQHAELAGVLQHKTKTP